MYKWVWNSRAGLGWKEAGHWSRGSPGDLGPIKEESWTQPLLLRACTMDRGSSIVAGQLLGSGENHVKFLTSLSPATNRISVYPGIFIT